MPAARAESTVTCSKPLPPRITSFTLSVMFTRSARELANTNPLPSARASRERPLASRVSIVPAKLQDTSHDDGKWFVLKTRAAGEIKLTARSRGRSADATLSVVTYPSTRWASGETRYTSNGAGGDQ